MKVVGIICEYNPFHNGHKRQIETVRQSYGKDTAIVAVMSGNYTQRGEVSVFDKHLRAESAVLGGVNLVLELPFPFCCTGAEYFAKAGIKILESTGIIDVLSFGTEAERVEDLKEAADVLTSNAYSKAFLSAKEKEQNLGHPALTEKVMAQFLGAEKAEILHYPNNILAIEYLKSCKAQNAAFEIHTVKRNTDYHGELPTDTEFASAGCLRDMIRNHEDFSLYVPKEIYPLYRKALDDNDYCDVENALSPSILSSLLLNKADAENVFDADAGLYHRLQNAAGQAIDMHTLLTLSETKKYTKARIRRVALFSYFGVTSADVCLGPSYLQVLAADGVGCSLLKQMKNKATLPILTKPADAPENIREIKGLSDSADSVYALSKFKKQAPSSALAFTPYIKK